MVKYADVGVVGTCIVSGHQSIDFFEQLEILANLRKILEDSHKIILIINLLPDKPRTACCACVTEAGQQGVQQIFFCALWVTLCFTFNYI